MKLKMLYVASVAGAALLTQSASALIGPQPWVIAHRGASGARPEHTVEAYELAVENGADFIECDVVVTKDLKLVCRHEPLVSGTTDADEKFPELITTYTIDGSEYTGVFTTDLTLEQIKTLRAKQPNSRRDPQYDGMFEVPTLEEHIDVALNAGRTVGIYPETKHPMWHNSLDIMEGTTMEDLLLEVLTAKGYSGDVTSDSWKNQPVFIQSFEVGNLKYLSEKTELPLVQLLGGWEGYVTPDTGKTHAEMTTEEALDEIATYAAGVGPWKNTVLPVDAMGYVGESTGLVARLHARNLQVHPYTFRNEDNYLAWTWAQDPYAEYHSFVEKEMIDGFFTDFPETGIRWRQRTGLGDYKAPLAMDRPWVIAHRGSSGVMPEHTREAYLLAMQQGADFIECDVVVTKDLKLVCRHEPLLSGTTDADEKFPDMITTYTIDGSEYTGVFTTDLTLDQIKTLRAVQSNGLRDPNYDGMFEVPTVEEYIDIAMSGDRVVGIYPETKHPMWHNSLDIMEGTTMEDLLLEVLTAKGYSGDVTSDSWAMHPVFIQSFEVGNLKYLSERTDLPLVQLLGGWEGYVTPDTGKSHAEMTTEEALDEIATYAAGVGPWKDTLVPAGGQRLGEATDLVERLHARGLQVHPYTFRNEARYLAFEYTADARMEYDLLVKGQKLDGIFTDFPATFADYVKQAELEGYEWDILSTMAPASPSDETPMAPASPSDETAMAPASPSDDTPSADADAPAPAEETVGNGAAASVPGSLLFAFAMNAMLFCMV